MTLGCAWIIVKFYKNIEWIKITELNLLYGKTHQPKTAIERQTHLYTHI